METKRRKGLTPLHVIYFPWKIQYSIKSSPSTSTNHFRYVPCQGLIPFHAFIKSERLKSPKGITHNHLIDLVSDFKLLSVHAKKSRVWAVKQIFHFLAFRQWASEDIVRDLPYLKIERTVPKWAMKSSLRLAFPPGKPKDRNMSYVKG